MCVYTCEFVCDERLGGVSENELVSVCVNVDACGSGCFRMLCVCSVWKGVCLSAMVQHIEYYYRFLSL